MMRFLLGVLALPLLSACGGGDGSQPVAAASAGMPTALDRQCDEAVYPSQAWTACEQANAARFGEAPRDALQNPDFLQQVLLRSQKNGADLLSIHARDPSQFQSLNTPFTPISSSYFGPLVGDPYRYPDAPGPNGADFYANEAEVIPVTYYDRSCARITGRVWQPKPVPAGRQLPAVVIENGSVVGVEPLYWWAAQALVRAGYQVFTHDQRGQGRADFIAPDGRAGSNIEPEVFWLGAVDAIDFLRSRPSQPYPHNVRCAGTYPTPVTAYNPLHASLDRERLGLAGHSFGAAGVTWVQSYGAPGADPWPGLIDRDNPVDVIVAWDALGRPDSPIAANASNYWVDGANLAGPLQTLSGKPYPAVVPRVPALDLPSEYGVFAFPFTSPPDPEQHLKSFRVWQAAGVPVVAVTTAGTVHTESSPAPLIVATSWCPVSSRQVCEGGWGLPLLEHYTVAWFDRWLKQPGEAGHDTADARLLDDAGPQGAAKMSWHFRSARDFPARNGQRQRCDAIRAGCP